MTHPLAQDLSDLSDEKLTKKITDLFNKLGMATMSGMEPDLLNQIHMMIQTYQEEEQKRLGEKMKSDAEEADEYGYGYGYNFNDYTDIET